MADLKESETRVEMEEGHRKLNAEPDKAGAQRGQHGRRAQAH